MLPSWSQLAINHTENPSYYVVVAYLLHPLEIIKMAFNQMVQS